MREYEGLKTSSDAGFPPTLLPASPVKRIPMFKKQQKFGDEISHSYITIQTN